MAPHLDSKSPKAAETALDRISRRKAMKHMVEKRRRNKMNNLLEDMKNLVLEGMNKDPTQYEKMEKADILEMTLQFLVSTSRKQPKGAIPHSLHKLPPLAMPVPVSPPALPLAVPQYGLGYQSCLSETKRFLQGAAVSNDIASRLVGHLEVSMGTRSQPRDQPRAVPEKFQKQLEISIPGNSTAFASSTFSHRDSLLKTETQTMKPGPFGPAERDSKRYQVNHSVVADIDMNNNLTVRDQGPVGGASPQWRPW